MNERVVLLVSSTETLVPAVSALLSDHGGDIVALVVDLGGRGAASLRHLAVSAGARRCHVVDARDRFARECVWPSLRAGAVGADGRPLIPALGHVAMARGLVEIARLEGVVRVALTSAGEDAERLGRLVRGFAPDLSVLAPSAASGDAVAGASDTLWGRTSPARPGDPSAGPTVAGRTRAADAHASAVLEIRFESGLPVATSGVDMPLVELIESLTTIGRAHGVGRGEEAGGTPSMAHDAPAAAILHAAHASLEALVLPADLLRFKAGVSREFAGLIHEGRWGTPLHEALDAFMAASQTRVTGTVRLEIAAGRIHVVPHAAEPSLYDRSDSVTLAAVV